MTEGKSVVTSGFWSDISGAASDPHPTWVLGILGVIMLVWATYRLLAEWQRRVTLDRILARAPAGSVIMQEKGPGGPAVSIWVGQRTQPVALAHERIYLLVQHQFGPLVEGRTGRDGR